MAKRPKLVDISNGYDRSKLEGYLTSIDAADQKLATLKSDYMTKCKAPRGDIAVIFEDAKANGIPDRAFRAVVKNHRLNRKIAGNVGKLDQDDQDSYERIVEALGDFVDLPLGQAAVARAGQAPGHSVPGAA